MTVRIIWGCNPAQQFELGWVNFLLKSIPSDCNGTVLVESGLLHLERPPSLQRLKQQSQLRNHRIAALATKPLTLIHLSDEEGFDADDLYSQLPASCNIWRNFPHPRLMIDRRVRSFPIGPRELFLVKDELMVGTPASNRPLPWAFMGTLWSSGSRTAAISYFLRGLPNGFFYGGKRFGTGLPLEQYRQLLMQSVFALAPEGDRHLDTFRLWESLCCGCIPLVVNHAGSAEALLGYDSPIPVFDCWPEALDFAQQQLRDCEALDELQANVQSWWQILRQTLQRDLESGLCL